MTTHWADMQNADVILNIGSNSAENHPVSSKWLNRAHEKGAIWIVVDPRYTRTAEMADIYCPIRSGTDIAFYGGLYNYMIENLIEPGLYEYMSTGKMDKYNFEYLINYTNASYILEKDYEFDPETGLFSGWDPETETYNSHSWHYETDHEEPWDTSAGGAYAWAVKDGVPQFNKPVLTVPKMDKTLTNPRCVYQVFKQHYSRYTMEKVCEVCGMDIEDLRTVYAAWCTSCAPGKAGAILYALGQTQHTYGAQNTRAMSVLQLLSGNVGVPGGGVCALRGEPNVQGATDMGMLVNEQPAYLKWANTTDRDTLAHWLESQTYSDGYYTNKPKFMVSALKEWYGDNATVKNDYGYDWWPKVPSHDGSDWTEMSSFEKMKEGTIQGYFAWGMNPCHSAPNSSNVRRSMANLDWNVVVDQVITETASFWDAPDMDATQIGTTCYFLPCALIYEKPGTILNSGRWMQWRYQAVEPWDEAKPDYEICDLLWREICRLYAEEGGANPDPILKMKWDYYLDGKIDPRPVSWALNGYRVKSSDWKSGFESGANGALAAGNVDLLAGYSELGADGSTACGMWIYSGFYANSAAPLDPAQQAIGRRNNKDTSGLGLYSDWAFAWPNNRRIIYNRASADMQGQPWAPDKALVKWDKKAKKWLSGYDNGLDIPDFAASKTLADGTVQAIEPNNKAFFMLWEQNGRLESYGMVDGPLPEHYEPFETPLSENLLNGRLNSPCFLGRPSADGNKELGTMFSLESTRRGSADEFPIVATTYSVTEHWQTGGQTRACPALVEAFPGDMIEMSPELAAEKGIGNGDKVRVWNKRASVVVTAVVTKRVRPLTVNGKTQHLVGMTHHYSWGKLYGNTLQGAVNDLTPNVGDPNSQTPEYKAFLVNIEKA